jgi:acyl-coenzyme A thioesterase 13
MGQKILIESQVVHLGKRMGITTGVIRAADGAEGDGKVLYTCEHGKANLGGPGL